MTLQLDKGRPFGTIHPPMDGAHYEQDGKLFDNDGRPMSKAGADKGAAKSAPSSSTTEAKNTTHPEDIDLAAWVKGEIKPPFFAVKKAALAQFPDIDTTNAGTIKARLAAEGVGANEAA